MGNDHDVRVAPVQEEPDESDEVQEDERALPAPHVSRTRVRERERRHDPARAARTACADTQRPLRATQLKLDRLEAATSLRDLAALPGNRFEALSGDRKGQYSIRINDQWRICFEWPEGDSGPANVEIVDYH